MMMIHLMITMILSKYIFHNKIEIQEIIKCIIIKISLIIKKVKEILEVQEILKVQEIPK